MTKSQTSPTPLSPPAPPSPPVPPSPPSKHRSESFNNWASGSAAILSLIVAGFSVYLTLSIDNINQELKNLEANRKLSELIGTSIQHLISSSPNLRRDIAVLAISSALTNKDIPEHHNLLLSYRITRRIARTPVEKIKRLEKSELSDLNNRMNDTDNHDTDNLDNQNIFRNFEIIYEKNAEAAYKLDKMIEKYDEVVREDLKTTRCYIAEKINAADKSFKCDREETPFSYEAEAKRLRKENVANLASVAINSGEEWGKKTPNQIQANNLAREGISKILDLSDKDAFVNVYRDLNTVVKDDASKILSTAFLEKNQKWLVPKQFVDVQLPKNSTSAVRYYGKENKSLANNLVEHLKQTLDPKTYKSLGEIKLEELDRKANNDIDIEVPDNQLELWLVTEEKTEEGENSTETE